MKRLLTAIAATLVLVSAHGADVVNNTKAKVDPKNNKVSNPVVAKPKEPIMTRDELRACMDTREANDAEVRAINALVSEYKAGAEKLKGDKAQLEKESADLEKRVTDTKADYEAIVKANEEFKVAGPKMEKADFEAKQKELKDRATAFEEGRNKLLADNTTLNERKVAFGTRIDELNAIQKSIEDRRDANLDKQDEWKAQCSKKKYDEADEAAIKKERAAKAAADAASTPK